ncbi:hypothetical protein [Amycolatopsis regifaucium]|uniref:Uncharacterized protein n=1 Tax=Amycolatopsis regifaucium TaxID=546365 RepID=A0A154MI38_9PSEU|nr:hypothetical protein [Amycolatopsis regifaucium]KZB83790.1 hypothetical protein AVL48_34910 [Amycolatopsis regifaucium]OKA06769.1 hypothetical protein ATP06_0219710 [Amycolatopsis regifaucium]SFH26379.1 hypothetical protein SAMN04489731_103228 [Amycolatopsis regifaucium]
MKELRPIERVAYATGAFLFLSGIVHAVVLIASDGSWTGPLSMRKAVTFGLSFGLTLATVAWATSYVAVRPRVRDPLLGVFTVASVLETALVSMQAWRGVPSHFNFETGFDNAVSTTLAAGGGVLILTAVSFTAAAMHGEGETTASMRLAVRAGLVALLVALGAGAAMIASGVVEARGGNPQAAYTTAGALKPLHAVAMHAILILPGLAWLLRFADWTERRRVRWVWTAIGAYAVLTAVVGVESVTGVSPLAASAVEMVTSGVALGVLGLTGAAALREAVRKRSRVL